MCKRHCRGGVCSGSLDNQRWGFVGLPAWGGVMNDPTGTDGSAMGAGAGTLVQPTGMVTSKIDQAAPRGSPRAHSDR